MDNGKKEQWVNCIAQSAIQIRNSSEDADIEWNLHVLQMAIDKMKSELNQ